MIQAEKVPKNGPTEMLSRPLDLIRDKLPNNFNTTVAEVCCKLNLVETSFMYESKVVLLRQTKKERGRDRETERHNSVVTYNTTDIKYVVVCIIARPGESSKNGVARFSQTLSLIFVKNRF